MVRTKSVQTTNFNLERNGIDFIDQCALLYDSILVGVNAVSEFIDEDQIEQLYENDSLTDIVAETDSQTHSQSDSQTDWQTDSQTDSTTDSQTESATELDSRDRSSDGFTSRFTDGRRMRDNYSS